MQALPQGMTILEQLDIELPEDDRLAEGTWFLDWVLRAPGHAGTHLTASYHAIAAVAEQLPGIVGSCSLHEYFAGIGGHAVAARYLLRPELHTASDFSPDSVEWLRRVLPATDVEVSQADAYARGAVGADVHLVDFGDMTVWRTREGEKHRALLDGIFEQEPYAVVVTDIAKRYLHLHRERYETLLGEGTCGSYATYLEALAARFQALYGYELLVGYTHSWSTVMAFVPEGVSADQLGFRPVPAEPVGVKLW